MKQKTNKQSFRDDMILIKHKLDGFSTEGLRQAKRELEEYFERWGVN